MALYQNDNGTLVKIAGNDGGSGSDDCTKQFTEMPVATSEYEDMIVQFVGDTTASYTNGYFYKCVEESGSYSWEAQSVQEGGGGSVDSLTTAQVNSLLALLN